MENLDLHQASKLFHWKKNLIWFSVCPLWIILTLLLCSDSVYLVYAVVSA